MRRGSNLRLCSIHSIDVDDVYFEDKYVELEHRPESETTLKNGEDSERVVGLPDMVINAVQAWVENPDRPDVTGDDR